MTPTKCRVCGEGFHPGDLAQTMGIIGHIVLCPACRAPNKAAGFKAAPITNLNDKPPPPPPPVRFLYGDDPPPKRSA